MKKRVLRTVFLFLYCILAAVGFVLDFKLFSGKISRSPFVYYTSLSNMACSGFMVAALVQNFRKVGQPWSRCKFVFTVMILLTAIVYNLLLNSHGSLVSYFSDVKNALYHLILPGMFVLDWFLFYDRGTAKPLYPLLSVIPPMIYAAYILARAAIVKAVDLHPGNLYPYFFLNVDQLGWSGFALWMIILLAGILALGYGLYALDRLPNSKVIAP